MERASTASAREIPNMAQAMEVAGRWSCEINIILELVPHTRDFLTELLEKFQVLEVQMKTAVDLRQSFRDVIESRDYLQILAYKRTQKENLYRRRPLALCDYGENAWLCAR